MQISSPFCWCLWPGEQDKHVFIYFLCVFFPQAPRRASESHPRLFKHSAYPGHWFCENGLQQSPTSEETDRAAVQGTLWVTNWWGREWGPGQKNQLLGWPRAAPGCSNTAAVLGTIRPFAGLRNLHDCFRFCLYGIWIVVPFFFFKLKFLGGSCYGKGWTGGSLLKIFFHVILLLSFIYHQGKHDTLSLSLF